MSEENINVDSLWLIGDVYKKSGVVPLAFYLMDAVKHEYIFVFKKEGR